MYALDEYDYDRDESPNGIYLHPGQMLVSARGQKVTTILGSCVAVCLWDSAAQVGGINHYLLATGPARGNSDLRYGNTAIARLLEEMIRHGASLARLTAKVFGGACVMEVFNSARLSIGDQNINVARETLARHHIEIIADQTGGKRGRKLIFHTGNGCVSMKEI